MNELSAFLVRYGYWVTLGSVFFEQMGLPLPAVPILIGMGALARSGDFSLPGVLLIALTGSLAADLIWYYLGFYYGRSVLGVLCRISLEPDYCIRRTEDAFVRRGIWALPLAKFVPGLNAAAVPLAGMIKIGFLRFLAFDTAGLVLWSGGYATLGYIFRNEVERLMLYLSKLGTSFGVTAGIVVGGYIAYKYIQRRRFLKTLTVERITPEELKAIMDTKHDVFVLDLRNQLDVNLDRFRIPGAFHTLPELLEQEGDIPRDKEVILYCT